jgi:CHAD domain-containing protein
MLSGALAERWDRFMREVARCRRMPTEPAIHDLRVATRRLLAAMAMVDAVLPGRHFRRSSDELRRHLKSFNVVRDVHVQLLAVRGLRRRFPILERYQSLLRRQELALLRGVRGEIRSIRQDTLIRSIAEVQGALAGLYGGFEAADVVRAMVIGSAASAYGKVIARRAGLSALDPRSVHRMRVAFKKFRYAVELARPLLPWADRKRGRAMDDFQTAMGQIQDLQVLLTGLRRFAQRDTRRAAPFLLPALQFLASARAQKMNSFLQAADTLQKFWR